MNRTVLTTAIMVLGMNANLTWATDMASQSPPGPAIGTQAPAWYAPQPDTAAGSFGVRSGDAAQPLSQEAVTGVGIHQSEFQLLWDDSLPPSDGVVPMAAEPKVANVSEPGTLGLLGLGLAALGLMRSRR